MKKLAFLAILASAAMAAGATEVLVTGERDTTQGGISGYSVAVAQPITAVKGLTVKGQFETISVANDRSTEKYEVRALYDVSKVGPVTITGIVGLGHAEYQAADVRGTYAVVGAQLSVPVSYVAGLSANVALTQSFGATEIRVFDRAEATIGVSYALTKSVAVNASATYYDNVPGNNLALGVSYKF